MRITVNFTVRCMVKIAGTGTDKGVVITTFRGTVRNIEKK